jgi:MYXO-CTERM domain-containing protein
MMRARSLTLAVTALATAAAAAPARAHEIRAHLSSSGLDFVEQQLPGLVPSTLNLPTVTAQIADPCPGSTAITWTQSNTTLNLWVDSLDLSLRHPGALRLDLTLTAAADGTAYIDNPYACFGSATCSDSLYVSGARAIVDFDAWVDASGQPRVALSNVTLDVEPSNLDFALSDCAIDGLVNLVVDLGKGWAIDQLKAKVQGLAETSLAPQLEALLGSMATYDGQIGSADFDAHLTAIDIATAGIDVAGDVDLTSRYAPDACIAANDPGDPSPAVGDPPDLSDENGHIAFAVNLGLVNDAIYHVWREGFLCVTPEKLHAFGFDLDLNAVAALLPVFPSGTSYSLQAIAEEPPVMEAAPSDHVDLTMVIPSLRVEMTATTPDGAAHTMAMTAGARAHATLALDPARNAFAMQLSDMTVNDLQLDDGWGLLTVGIDDGAVEGLMNQVILPDLLSRYSPLPVTGAIVGASGYYVIPRDLHTTQAHLVAAADLFHAPDDDFNAPETSIDMAPVGAVGPARAKLLVSGSDAEDPSELLRFQVSVDGVAAAPTYVREIKIGRPGESGTRHVEVRAMDLAGNLDPSPATIDVQVDGIAPIVTMTDVPPSMVDTAAPTFAFTATDDVTPADQLVSTVKVYDLTGDPKTPVYQDDLDPGATGAALRLEPAHSYRVVLSVTDQAGNAGVRAFHLEVSPDAKPLGGGCGCNAGGRSGTGSAGAAALLALAGLAFVRRRR